ncbi:MAG: hypothetical protein ACXABY_35980 [Candidatus Thorarchaeota archaeon]|jgi:hypothetical protein
MTPCEKCGHPDDAEAHFCDPKELPYAPMKIAFASWWDPYSKWHTTMGCAQAAYRAGWEAALAEFRVRWDAANDKR